MNKSKKVFLAIAIIFVLLVLYIAYDIGTRTTFPGSRDREEPIDSVLLEGNSHL